MTTDPNERIARLENETRRLRRWVQALGLALVVATTLGATDSPKELILRKLSIVDAKGVARIVAHAEDDGSASLAHYDRKGRKRIASGTDGVGAANTIYIDRNQRARVQTGTASDDSSRIVLYSRRGGVGWSETMY